MKHTTPKVSIGLPVYNGEAFLAQTIESLLAQTYADFELLITDNGSTDATADICDEFALRDERIKFERQPRNKGVWWNFNRAFEMSQGKYFRWHAADDLCRPQYLERCVAVLDQQPDVVMCYPQTAVIDEDGSIVFQRASAGSIGEDPLGLSEAAETRRIALLDSSKPHQRYLGVLVYAERMTEIFGLIRSEALRRTRLHRYFDGSEKVLLAELCLQGRFYEVPEPLFLHRTHSGRCSYMPAAAKQQTLMGAAKPRRRQFVPPIWHCATAHFASPWRYPLTLSQRLRCLPAWFRYLMQARKWRRAGAEALAFIGVASKKRNMSSPKSKAAPRQEPVLHS